MLIVLAALAGAGAAAAAGPRAQLAAARNYTVAERPLTDIHFIVIHVTQGPFAGTVSWLRDPRSHASANFVVSRTGQAVQLVPLHDIAWHAGNWAYNLRSVGIENAGYVNDPAGFTLREYRETARLTATIARLALMPIDRRHIIGHYQVPDPNDPLQGGGIDGHTDPGRYWNWQLFMRLVRRDAFPQHAVAHTHVGLRVESSTLYGGQIVNGLVPWRARVGGPVTKVAFLVDGHVRWIDHVAPFAFLGGGLWNTTALRNGKHELELRAYGAKGSWTRHRFTIRVRNEAFTLAVVGLQPKQQLNGVVPIQAVFTGAPPARVLLLVDGRQVDHDTSAPYLFHWDSRRVADGPHTISLVARARDRRVVRSSVAVVVANAAPPAIAADSLGDGQTVAGLQHWLVTTTGNVAHVDFLVDGALESTATAAPYAWDWDTSAAAPGQHTLEVRAVAPDGTTAQQTLTVTVAPAAAAG